MEVWQAHTDLMDEDPLRRLRDVRRASTASATDNWHNVIFEHSRWEGTKRAVKRRLRQRCRSDPEDELDWKAGVL